MARAVGGLEKVGVVCQICAAKNEAAREAHLQFYSCGLIQTVPWYGHIHIDLPQHKLVRIHCTPAPTGGPLGVCLQVVLGLGGLRVACAFLLYPDT